MGKNKTVDDIIEDIQIAQIEASGRFLRQFDIRKMTVEELLNLLIPNNISFTIKFKKQVNDFNNKTKIKLKKIETNVCSVDPSDLRKRTLFDKLKERFICKKKGHTVSRVHPKYPSKYCSVCRKHRSEF